MLLPRSILHQCLAAFATYQGWLQDINLGNLIPTECACVCRRNTITDDPLPPSLPQTGLVPPQGKEPAGLQERECDVGEGDRVQEGRGIMALKATGLGGKGSAGKEAVHMTYVQTQGFSLRWPIAQCAVYTLAHTDVMCHTLPCCCCCCWGP